jgi:septal ring factor EnvC (AmiA/AmiB activator)
MRVISFILCLLLSVNAIAQVQYVTLQPTKAQLEAKRKEIQDAISETEKELAAIKSNKKATMGELSALQNKLSLRQRQIGNINDELSDIDNTIKSSSKEIGTMKQKLEVLKVRYAQSIRYAYETRSSYDMLAFLFSSSDFNDAMRRMKYLKKFREFRKEQVDQIHNTQTELTHKIGVLTKQKAQKDELLNDQVQQKQVLIKETEQKDQVIQELKGKESDLLKEIEKGRKEQGRLNSMITKVIEREMEKAAKLAELEEEKRKAATAAVAAKEKAIVKTNNNTSVPVENNPPPNVAPRPRVPEREAQALLLTPNDIELSSNFEGNRGKLYWPVSQGVITDHFGRHAHPLAPQVMVDNAGIDIQTSPGATVSAVFEGVVTSIFYTVGDNQTVMLKHANYFTVYNNLTNVSVKINEHVNTKQALGTVTNNDEGVPIINFQIWKAGSKKGSMKLNPEQWIGRAR